MSSLAISVFFVEIRLTRQETTDFVTIPAVDVSKTYIQPSCGMPTGSYSGSAVAIEGDGETGAMFVKLTNSTTVTITRNASTPSSPNVSLTFKGYVVEYLQPDAPTSISVDYYQLILSIAAGLTSVTVAIPAVVVANTYILPEQSIPAKINSTSTPDVQDGQIISTYVKLTTSTSVTVARDTSGVRIAGVYRIIEYT